MIYLDNAATTSLGDAARAALLGALAAPPGNPAALHAPGVAAGQALERARAVVARAVGAPSESVVFTSGGSEANALALLGVASRGRQGGHLICASIEHASVLETCRRIGAAEGWELTELPVDPDGLVSPEALREALRPDTRLVSVGHANNVLGTVQPLRRLVRALGTRRSRVVVHCDAVQSFLKAPVDLRRLGVDLLSLSAHKVHGPQGVGALVVRPGVWIEPLWRGGEQEQGRRAGTPNVAGAVSFAAAIDDPAWTGARERVRTLRDRLASLLRERLPDLRHNGSTTERLPNILHISLPGVRSEPLLHALEALGVCASVGSACHASAGSLSHVLRAIGYREGDTWGHLRLSLSRDTTASEIDRAADAVAQAHRQLLSAGVA